MVKGWRDCYLLNFYSFIYLFLCRPSLTPEATASVLASAGGRATFQRGL